MPDVQEVVNQFAELIVGKGQLAEDDPRLAYITIASICLHEFVNSTVWAYEHGKLPLPDEGQFKPLHEVKD